MGSLQGETQDNFGGMQWCKWANVAFVTDVTTAYDHSVTAVTFAGDYEWESFPTGIETISVEHVPVGGVTGEAFNSIVELFIPGSIQYFESRLQSMVVGKFIVAVNDWDERLLVVGTKKNGCNCTIKYNSQSKVSGLEGTKITFSLTRKHLSLSVPRVVLFP